MGKPTEKQVATAIIETTVFALAGGVLVCLALLGWKVLLSTVAILGWIVALFWAASIVDDGPGADVW